MPGCCCRLPRRVELSMNPEVIIRRATPADLKSITEIYNEAIENTTATFDIDPKNRSEQERWFEEHGERFPILVASLDDRVVGWASLSRWSEKRAYDVTAEFSFYVASSHRGRGIGRRLKTATIEEARRLGFHSLIARIAQGSLESLHLAESFGFTHVGTLKEVGRKFNRLLDVHILQLVLEDDKNESR